MIKLNEATYSPPSGVVIFNGPRGIWTNLREGDNVDILEIPLYHVLSDIVRVIYRHTTW